MVPSHPSRSCLSPALTHTHRHCTLHVAAAQYKPSLRPTSMVPSGTVPSYFMSRERAGRFPL
eukprot:scaffold18034_cov21-Tisochrysis_lutea.AAC.4